MKIIPELYKNPDLNPINNNKTLYKITKENNNNQEEIKNILDSIFYRFGHSYNKKIIIVTKDKEYETYLIARTKEAIYTLENERILISDILKIKDCSQQ